VNVTIADFLATKVAAISHIGPPSGEHDTVSKLIDWKLQHGIEAETIPALRCALARDVGSRLNNKAARYLSAEWLPHSGEELSGYPVVFHYVNVGPKVKDEEAITDVYLPLEWRE